MEMMEVVAEVVRQHPQTIAPRGEILFKVISVSRVLMEVAELFMETMGLLGHLVLRILQVEVEAELGQLELIPTGVMVYKFLG
tara:strand:- start:262 stop:510 length:249 start_codon:yes stop_codon:yes gene_type:complete